MGPVEFLGKSKVADVGRLYEAFFQSKLLNSKDTIPHVGMFPIFSFQTCETKSVTPGL